MNSKNSKQWYQDSDLGTWEKAKLALKADWEQTKSDFGSKKAEDLNQSLPDTLRQMAGKEPLPNFEEREEAFRYGHVARHHFQKDWSPDLMPELRDGYPGNFERDRPFIQYSYQQYRM